MIEQTELYQPSEPTGLPEDLFDNPAKYDADIPLWRRTVGLVRQYQTAKPNGRDKILTQLSESVVKDPKKLTPVLNNFMLIDQVKPEIDILEIYHDLNNHWC